MHHVQDVPRASEGRQASEQSFFLGRLASEAGQTTQEKLDSEGTARTLMYA